MSGTETGDSTTGNQRGPQKWWQWFLVYPALAVAIIGAVPTYHELFRSAELGVKFGESADAVKRKDMWQKNLECTAAPFDWLITSSNVQVDATICSSGDVFVRVKAPENRQFYEWVSVDSFFETASLPPQIFSQAHALAEGIPNHSDAGGRSIGAFHYSGGQVICQRWLNQKILLRRVNIPGQGCFDEHVNTYNGVVIKQTPAPCDSRC